jgi:serine/threonine-protein kinase
MTDAPPEKPRRRRIRAPVVGATVGRYQLTRHIGKGGMGSVFEALHTELNTRCALKILHPQYSYNAKLVRRFFNEARAVVSIGHPNIVEVHDFGTTDEGYCYLQMELLDGRSLHTEMRALQRMDARRACHICGQIARALAASHAHGIVHRDLKPENIFLVEKEGDRDFVKVLDFGIAKLLKRSQLGGETESGVVLGTTRYMSPEQCRSAKGIDHRTDIYSFGMMLYIMLAGKMPFVADTPGDMVVKILTEKPRPLSQWVPGIPPALEAAVLRALDKEPDKRFQRMDDLGDALAPFGGPARPAGQAPLPVAEYAAEEESLDPTTSDDEGDDVDWYDPEEPTALSDEARRAPGAMREQMTRVATPHARGPKPRVRAGAVLIAVSVIVALASAGGLWMLREAQREPVARSLPQVRAPAPTVTPLSPTVRVTIDSRPAGATVRLDGAQVGVTPLELIRPRDPSPHALRLELDGFVPLDAQLTADGDRRLDLALAEKPKARPKPKRSSGSGDLLAPSY